MSNSQSTCGDFVTVRLADQLLGIPVLRVHDVFNLGPLTRVPQAPSMVAGVMNLRGRIVTVIDLRERLGLPTRDAKAKAMCLVVEQGGQPYALVVDAVGDVVPVSVDRHEPNPTTLSTAWRLVSDGVYRLDDGLMMVLDIAALLDVELARAA